MVIPFSSSRVKKGACYARWGKRGFACQYIVAHRYNLFLFFTGFMLLFGTFLFIGLQPFKEETLPSFLRCAEVLLVVVATYNTELSPKFRYYNEPLLWEVRVVRGFWDFGVRGCTNVQGQASRRICAWTYGTIQSMEGDGERLTVTTGFLLIMQSVLL